MDLNCLHVGQVQNPTPSPLPHCSSLSTLSSFVLFHLYILLFFFFLINLLIYLFLALLGLRCCVQAFSSCSERGLLFVAVHGLLIAVASLVAEHRL